MSRIGTKLQEAENQIIADYEVYGRDTAFYSAKNE